MNRSARYNVLEDEDTSYSNYHGSRSGDGESTTELQPREKPVEFDQAEGQKLRRFYLRALVGVLGPLVVCAYFIVIWLYYIVPIDPENPLKFGRHGATWIFYSWFVFGVIGLNLSLYGLTGVEASMLMEPKWNVRDATRLMLHADNTWSGPGGWMKTVKWAVTNKTVSRAPSVLWFILSLPSLLVFIAWPLSGLTMEVTQGYRRSRAPGPVDMTGYYYDSFNERSALEAYDRASLMWRNAVNAQIPNASIAYTPEGFDRSKVEFLKKMPTVFPRDEGIPELFLTAQAETPTSGIQWGLLMQYDCSIIDQAEDFTILSKRNKTMLSLARGQRPGEPLKYTIEDNYVISSLRQTDWKWVRNLGAVVEFGNDQWPTFKTVERLQNSTKGPFFYDCYYNNDKNETGEYPGFDHESILEVLLWQYSASKEWNSTRNNPTSPQYDLTLDHEIKSLFGAYDLRDGYSKEVAAKWPPQPMSAIGVQCKSRSSVGTAEVNAVKSSFTNFQKTDTHISDPLDRCGRRFDNWAPINLMYRPFMDNNGSWLSSLFTSSSAPPRYYGSGYAKSGYYVQLGYLQAEQLRQSMLHAYASFAIQLMYNDQGVTTRNGSRLSFSNPNVTAYEPGTVLTPGVMPSLVPLTLFCAWAIVSSFLGLLYGFRRRWTETLDGHTMFRLGAELSDHDKRELLKTSNIVKKDDCRALDDIPALVGDTKPEMYVGRIGLVKENKAVKRKLYE